MLKKSKKLYFFFKKILTSGNFRDIIVSFISVYVKFSVSLRKFLKRELNCRFARTLIFCVCINRGFGKTKFADIMVSSKNSIFIMEELL